MKHNQRKVENLGNIPRRLPPKKQFFSFLQGNLFFRTEASQAPRVPILFFLWIFFLQLSFVTSAQSAYTNYNSILIGERASGMGGAFTALSGDPAACSFYNPATLSRMTGTSLSASVNLYNKYDNRFGYLEDNTLSQASEASLRANQGFFVPIPSSSGSVYSLGNFAVGLSIVFPDFEIYNGDVSNQGQKTSFLSLRDESLWIGGTIAVNLTQQTSGGLTVYYTSRSYQRSLSDHYTDPNSEVETIESETKSFTNNSIVYLFGLYHEWSSHWKAGISLRLPALEVSGKGSYIRSQLSASDSILPESIQLGHLASETRIPMKSTLGIAYEREKNWTLSMDFSYYDSDEYKDMESDVGGDLITHLETWNLNLGGEYYLKPWLAMRLGVFTNFSSSPHIPSTPAQRVPDRVDMFGWSANMSFQTSPHSEMTLGGYYTGGKGKSSQRIAGQIEKVDKSSKTFSFLVSTSFNF